MWHNFPDTFLHIQGHEYDDLLLRWDAMTPREASLFHPDIHLPDKRFVTTMMCEGSLYTPWLLARVKELGGRILQRKLARLEEVRRWIEWGGRGRRRGKKWRERERERERDHSKVNVRPSGVSSALITWLRESYLNTVMICYAYSCTMLDTTWW
jgi:hypothetical protein